MKQVRQMGWSQEVTNEICQARLKNICILYWNCASIRQCGPILESLLYLENILAIQKTHLGDEVLRVVTFKGFCNRQHLG